MQWCKIRFAIFESRVFALAPRLATLTDEACQMGERAPPAPHGGGQQLTSTQHDGKVLAVTIPRCLSCASSLALRTVPKSLKAGLFHKQHPWAKHRKCQSGLSQGFNFKEFVLAAGPSWTEKTLVHLQYGVGESFMDNMHLPKDEQVGPREK